MLLTPKIIIIGVSGAILIGFVVKALLAVLKRYLNHQVAQIVPEDEEEED